MVNVLAETYELRHLLLRRLRLHPSRTLLNIPTHQRVLQDDINDFKDEEKIAAEVEPGVRYLLPVYPLGTCFQQPLSTDLFVLRPKTQYRIDAR